MLLTSNIYLVTSACLYTVICVDLSANGPAGPCHVARSRSSGLMGAFVPQCTDDGKFRTLQCHGSTGYCWCVNEAGVEMENTRKGPSEGPVDCDAVKPGTVRPSFECRVYQTSELHCIDNIILSC